jgi:outer membrane protein assembly factor BamB
MRFARRLGSRELLTRRQASTGVTVMSRSMFATGSQTHRRIRGSWLIAVALIGWATSFSGAFDRAAAAEDWPQFRGPNAIGTVLAGSYPEKIGPEEAVVWKVALPPGHASPVIFGDRIYLAAERDKRLLTIALDRATGKLLWEREAPYTTLEEIHRIGSHCQSSPVTDGERVYTFFGSAGLFCHTRDGELVWKRPMGPFKNTFGAGSSPILVGDALILYQDHDTDSFVMSLDKRTGEVNWKTDRPDFPRNYGTPVVAIVGGKPQLVIAATLRVIGYDLETGTEQWTLRGISRFVSSTPCIGPDGVAYLAAWAAGGDEGESIKIEPFDAIIDSRDQNKNGQFEEGELPEGGIKQRFTQVDRDKTGSITRNEYEYFRTLFDKGRNVLIAFRPGGEGDITSTGMVWEQRKFVPFCTSPVVSGDVLFTVKDGGILCSYATSNGKPQKQGRLEAAGDYYASPVAADGKLYLVSEEGKLSVVRATGKWEVLHTADLGESAYATPALADGRIYLRTTGHLYCFGK